LHQFPSNRILTKPKILLAYVADFGIVTPTKELLLIELEKSDMRLLKKDGGIAAPPNHAFDQVRDWLHEVDEHRLAVLDSLGIAREEVSAIRGVVIAGRDSGCDAKNLRKLKGTDRDESHLSPTTIFYLRGMLLLTEWRSSKWETNSGKVRRLAGEDQRVLIVRVRDVQYRVLKRVEQPSHPGLPEEREQAGADHRPRTWR
jgi:Domain of unknown function (DUF4263)